MSLDKLNKIITLVSVICILLVHGCGTEEYQPVVGQIEGTVLDSDDNKPIVGCQVISDNYGTKHTDDKGHFVFDNVTPGNVSLTYQRKGYESVTRIVNVIAGQQISANISLNRTEVESSIKPNQTMLDFGTRTNILDLVLTNISTSTQSYSIYCESKEINFDPSQGRIIAGSNVIIKVSIDRSDLSEGHYERIFTIETAERKIDIQVVFDIGNVVRPVVKTVSLLQGIDNPSKIIAEGDVTVVGSSPISNHGFCYSTSADPTLEINEGYSKMGSMAYPSHFSGILSEMEFGKEYRVRAYATNNEGTGYGEVLTIVLKNNKIYNVVTESASDITHSSATLTGVVSEGATSDFSELGFCYGPTPDVNNKITNIKIQSNNAYVATLNDLKDDTEYYFRAFGICDGIERFGEIKTFRTDKKNTPSSIICITSEATEIHSTSATLNGAITSDGKTKIKEWGFYYGSNSNPTIRKVGMSYKVPTLIESQSVSFSITDLNENKEYYFKVYVIDGDNNVIQGDIKQFKTSIVPSINIDSLNMSPINSEDNWFQFEGQASLNPQGQTIIEAGFLCRADGYDFSYENSSEDILGPYNNGHTYRLICEINDNVIKGKTKVFNRSFLYIKAYMILSDGTIIYNKKHLLSNGTIYVSTDLWYPQGSID